MMFGLGATSTADATVDVTWVYQWILYGIGGLFLWAAIKRARN